MNDVDNSQITDLTSVTATLTEIVRQIAAQPDKVRVEINNDGVETKVLLYLSEEDKDRILANGSRTLRSLRSVVRALALKSGCQVWLDLA